MDSLPSRFKNEVFGPYLELLKAEFRIHPQFAAIRRDWENGLSMDRLVHGPFLERAQLYAPGTDIHQLGLHSDTVAAVEARLQGRGLYHHQSQALQQVLAGKNVVVATGTSSGKTLCFQLPILDALLKDPSPGLRAVIIYPLNALVNDQLEEWERLLAPHPDLTFAKFTGQTPRDQEDHEERLRQTFEKSILSNEPTLSDSALQHKVDEKLKAALRAEAFTPNHLRHRESIRRLAPNILITNFSMLEYLLVRPIDAPIFENAKLQFLVLDEAHAYRGVQATEIGYLLRRLKDRLGQPKPCCIATSATLGNPGDPESRAKVQTFARDLFEAEFEDFNPIYGTTAQPELQQPGLTPTPSQYKQAAERIRQDVDATVVDILDPVHQHDSLGNLLAHDSQLHRLRSHVLSRPRLAADAAQDLWPGDGDAESALYALLEVIAVAKRESGHDDMLPTRLHYFVKAQQGLHICLHTECPERLRNSGRPTIFPTRKNDPETPEGLCPHCRQAGVVSRLVELVSCRKCGWLYGALQDLGPRFRQNPEICVDPQEERFDNFDTELGWAADSFWCFFSVEGDLPYPGHSQEEEDDSNPHDLLAHPAEIDWCVGCGKKVEPGTPHTCLELHTRKLLIFHRQCPAHNQGNLASSQKHPLPCCPNCGARNNSGVELVRRFQESEDETGLAMAVPLAHFRVGPVGSKTIAPDPRKLLCFTDHRQRAAAFPSLLEEEVFTHEMGKKIVGLLRGKQKSWLIEDLARELAAIADKNLAHPSYDPTFFLPVSRLPEEPDRKENASEANDLTAWLAETLAYFGVPDSARESAEDIGLVEVEYAVDPELHRQFRQLFPLDWKESDSEAALQTLLAYPRRARAFTLPKRVPSDAPAFGRVATDIYFAQRVEGRTNTRGWLPRLNNDGSYRHNFVTDYLSRLTALNAQDVLSLALQIWELLISQNALKRDRDERFQLFYDHLTIRLARARYVCSRCGVVTAWSAQKCCLRKGCIGVLNSHEFVANDESIIARWVAGEANRDFSALHSEEHTAQINKDLAKEIEEAFRGNGVNLLSSTTTFEMGINIGDLQKLLLRNAPPTAASYVQRVGRAGRGKDKNAICVTLCRGSKYDLDMWQHPERLMSGTTRAPTVFLENRIIAQRHFNAVAFAAFLRTLNDDGLIEGTAQRIRIEGFISPTDRAGIPEKWLKIKRDQWYDFASWLRTKREQNLFHPAGNRILLDVLGNIDAAKDGALGGEKGYSSLLAITGAELVSLLKERQDRFNEGLPSQEVEQSVQNLLREDVIAMLAQAGFLPRYAFPLDVVPLETRRSRWSSDSDVELSRDRAIAISEFAPGAQVVARKRVFTSGGLYIACSEDKPERHWYQQCPCCNQIRTKRRKEEFAKSCEVCQSPIGDNAIRGFVEPRAFSVRFDGRRRDAARFTKSTLIRQKQALTHFIDTVDQKDFHESPLFNLALLHRGQLFRYNLGPGRKGFMLCPRCGTSHPMGAAPLVKHQELRSTRGTSQNCSYSTPYQRIAYAHQFESFCLVIRPTLPVGSVESLAYALHKGACACLELDSSDLGVAWRFLNRRTEVSSGKEIVLYDRTPGGAGFVAEARDQWAEVVAQALRICTQCTCEAACYECLKDFGNQFHHDALNRLSAAEYLRSMGSSNSAGLLVMMPPD